MVYKCGVIVLDEKWLLEQAAAENFVSTINNMYSTSYEILKHTDKPDILIGDQATGDKIGVEITHLFYDDEEAKTLLGKSPEIHNGLESAISLIGNLNRLLEQKAKKARGYDHNYQLALLVRVVSPVFDKKYFDRYESYIKVPDSDYRHIWLLFFDSENRGWNSIKTLQ